MKKHVRSAASLLLLLSLLLTLIPVGALAYEPAHSTVLVGLNSSLRSSRPLLPSVTLESSGGFLLGYYDDSRNFVELASTTAESVKLTAATGVISVSAAGEVLFQREGKLALTPAAPSDAGTRYRLPDDSYGNSRSYYGGFAFLCNPGSDLLTAVNYLPLEDYVRCVLPCEMPVSWSMEAVKAQAVCARTYAVRHIDGYASYGFDVCNTTYSQEYRGVYNWADDHSRSLADQAVADTAGQYLLYNDQPIDAVYYSSNGGATESAVNVWGTEIPYLIGKEDPYEQTPAAAIWSETLSAGQLYQRLKSYDHDLSIADVAQVACTYTATGNMASVTVTDSAGRQEQFLRGSCRSAFLSGHGSSSQRFTITQNSDVSYTLSNRGSGHNVGFSQYGARGMAEQGLSYLQILGFYYTGVNLNGTPLSFQSFSDVSPNDWFYADVCAVTEGGLFSGTGGGKFSPALPTSRASVWTVLFRMAGGEPSPDAETWYADARAWTMEQGISDGTAPNDNINREQLAALLYRYAECQGELFFAGGDPLTERADHESVSSWAVPAADWASRNGFITGKPGNLFDPQGPASRAEVAAVLVRFLESLME